MGDGKIQIFISYAHHDNVGSGTKQGFHDPNDNSGFVSFLHEALLDKLRADGYAFSLAEALQARQIETLLPAFDDTPSERNKLHRSYLRDCDSIILCWASGSEVWAKTNSQPLQDWQRLGRRQTFVRRAVVAGPPPGMPKAKFKKIFPKNQIDVVVDLTA